MVTKEKMLESTFNGQTSTECSEHVSCSQEKSHLQRCFWEGSLDSENSPNAQVEDIVDILHHCCMILGAYGSDINDLENLVKEHIPNFDKGCVLKFDHPNFRGACPPYFICVDHKRKEIGMYIRGMNLLHRQDYVALLSNHMGEEEFEGGHVHHGMMQSAKWAVTFIAPVLKEELLKYIGYRLAIVGHSLGAGVAALFALILLKDQAIVGEVSADQIRAYAIEPPRVMSVDLCARSSPHIYSIIYQDDFLPRVSTSSIKRILLVTLPFTIVVLCFHWLKQALRLQKDTEYLQLLPPGRIFHAVYKQPGVHHHVPLQVRVMDTSKGCFNRIVLSCSAVGQDHSVLHLVRHLKGFRVAEGAECLASMCNLNFKESK